MSLFKIFTIAITIWSLIVPIGCRERSNTAGKQSVTFSSLPAENKLTPEEQQKFESGKTKFTQVLNEGSVAVYSLDGNLLKDFVIGPDLVIGNYIFGNSSTKSELQFGIRIQQTSLEEAVGTYTTLLLGKDLNVQKPLLAKPITFKKGEDQNVVSARILEMGKLMDKVISKQTAAARGSQLNKILQTVRGFVFPTAQGADIISAIGITIVTILCSVIMVSGLVVVLVGGFSLFDGNSEGFKEGGVAIALGLVIVLGGLKLLEYLFEQHNDAMGQR